MNDKNIEYVMSVCTSNINGGLVYETAISADEAIKQAKGKREDWTIFIINWCMPVEMYKKCKRFL